MNEYYVIDPQTYDDQFWWKKDDIEFWKSTLITTHTHASILELAAGTGRLGSPLIREGAHYTGLELSKKYVKYANHKFKSYNPLILGDMRDFSFYKKYDFIFIGFNSFLHLLSESDAKQCLISIKRHMHVNTKVYIDILMPSRSLLSCPSSSILTAIEFFDSQKRCLSRIKEKFFYNSLDETVSVNWQYKNEKNICYKQFNFQMKLYYPDTMKKILKDTGFYIYNLWGSYDKAPHKKNSPLQIYELGL